jgi:hypothetical protein
MQGSSTCAEGTGNDGAAAHALPSTLVMALGAPSATAGCFWIAFSTSMDDTFWPPVTIVAVAPTQDGFQQPQQQKGRKEHVRGTHNTSACWPG